MIESAQHLPLYPLPEDWEERPKVTGFALDSPNANTLDDAIQAKELANGNLLIQIHISDISAYLDITDPIIKDAQERRTSVYINTNSPGDKCIPMLPPEITRLLSLKAEQEKEYKASITIEAELDINGGLIGETKIYKSKTQATFVPLKRSDTIPDEHNAKLLEEGAARIHKHLGNKPDRLKKMGSVTTAFNTFANNAAAHFFGMHPYLPVLKDKGRTRISAGIRRFHDLVNLLLIAHTIDDRPERTIFENVEKIRNEINKTQNPELETWSQRNIEVFLTTIDPLSIAQMKREYIENLLTEIEQYPDLIQRYANLITTLALQEEGKLHPIAFQSVQKALHCPKSAKALIKLMKKYCLQPPLNPEGNYESISGTFDPNTCNDFGVIYEEIYGPPETTESLMIIDPHSSCKLERKHRQEHPNRWELRIRRNGKKHVLAYIDDIPDNKTETKNTAIESAITALCNASTQLAWPSLDGALSIIALSITPIQLNYTTDTDQANQPNMNHQS